MPRKVLTAADLEGVLAGVEFTIAAGTLITPLAREEAARRNIILRVAQEETSQGQSSARRVVAIAADHGGFELKEEPVSLEHVLEESRHLLALRAKKREIVIQESLEPNLPRLWADERAVRQVQNGESPEVVGRALGRSPR